MMLAERRGGDLDTWLTQAEHSSLASIQKNGERDSPRLCSSQNGVYFRVEQWTGRGAGQLLEAKAPDRVRQGEFRLDSGFAFSAVCRSSPMILFPNPFLDVSQSLFFGKQ